MVTRQSPSNSFRFYSNLFQVLGFCPVEMSHSERLTSNILILISIFHIILLTSVVIFVCVFNRSIFWIGDGFGYFNDSILYAVVIVAYYAIILESLVKLKTQSKIWRSIVKFQEMHPHRAHRDIWNSKEFNIYFIGYFTMLISIECYRLPFIMSRAQVFNFWCPYIILLIVVRIRHTQYIFYLNIVKQQVEFLFQELKQIQEFSNHQRKKLNHAFRGSYAKFLYRRLYEARENYSVIFDISTEINEVFGWSHLVNLTHAFVQILTDFYWMYWNTDNNTFIHSGDGSLGTISSIVIVYLVFGYTTQLHEKAMKTGSLVHNINDINLGSKLQDLVESFSLQLLHQRIIFHAQGCFVLNLSILGDVITAITTYMVFFIQFTSRYKY